MGKKQPISSKAQLTVALFEIEDASKGIIDQIHSKILHCFSFPIQSTGILFYFCCSNVLFCFKIYAYLKGLEILQRALHSRNKKALELIAKGWNALKEVDRVIDYCELNDKRLIPLLRVMNVLSTYSYLLLI